MATHNSPKGRPVDAVTGDPNDISERGAQIVRLGDAMSQATDLLTRLVADGADMEGQAVDKLREASDEVTAELGKAASLYVEVGPHVRTYGDQLGEIQPRMVSHAEAATQYWSTLQMREDELSDARSRPVDYPDDDPDGSGADAADRRHAESVADAQSDRDSAFAFWKQAADDFDADYDAWEAAFDAAVAGVRAGTSGSIKDSWRDNLDGLVDFALKVLQVAGIVLAVLALVVGGPIVGILTLVVSVLTLVGTAWQYARGDASLVDLGFAIIGVIPFGHFGAFRSGGFAAGMRSWTGLSSMSVGDDVARWGLAAMGDDGLSVAQRLNPVRWASDMRALAPEAGYVTSLGGLADDLLGDDWEYATVVDSMATAREFTVMQIDELGTALSTVDLLQDVWTAPEAISDIAQEISNVP